MKKAMLLMATLVLVAGCKTASAPMPPEVGSCNPTDAGIYQALHAAQGSLNSLRATLSDPKTDANTVTLLKPYFNKADGDYNLAETVWQGYHAACMANPSASPASAQQALVTVQNDLQSVPKVNP